MTTQDITTLSSIGTIIRCGIDSTGEAAVAFEEIEAIFEAIESLSEGDTKRAVILARIGKNLVFEWSGINQRNRSEFYAQQHALKAVEEKIEAPLPTDAEVAVAPPAYVLGVDENCAVPLVKTI